MNTVEIPAELVTLLRTSLIGELAVPTGAIHDASMAAERTTHPEWFAEPLLELAEYRAALELVGWRDPIHEQSLTLDLDTHRGPIAKALNSRLEAEREFMNEEAGKPDRQAHYDKAAHNVGLINRFLADHDLADDE